MNNTNDRIKIHANTIPQGLLGREHTNTSKLSQAEKDRMMQKWLPREERLPDAEAMAKMAYSPSLKIATAEPETIKRDKEDWVQMIEGNKAKYAGDPNLGLSKVRRAHYGDGEHTQSPLTKEQILAGLQQIQNNNLLSKGYVSGRDAAVSDYSRNELRHARREKLMQQFAKSEQHYDEQQVVRANDRGPAGLRKGIRNVSEIPGVQAPLPRLSMPTRTAQEEEVRANSIVAAVELLKEQNQQKINRIRGGGKEDWRDDAMNNLSNRINTSVDKLHQYQTSESERIEQARNIDPAQAAAIFKDYFKSNMTTLGRDMEEIREHNQRRSESIKDQSRKAIRTTLDEPSLPVHSGNNRSNTLDRMIEALPNDLKERIFREATQSV